MPDADGADGGRGGAGAAGRGGADGGPATGADGGGVGRFGETGAEATPTGAVAGAPDGIGAVEPFGATGPDSSACALKLMRTVSFFKGTVEVLTEGFDGS